MRKSTVGFIKSPGRSTQITKALKVTSITGLELLGSLHLTDCLFVAPEQREQGGGRRFELVGTQSRRQVDRGNALCRLTDDLGLRRQPGHRPLAAGTRADHGPVAQLVAQYVKGIILLHDSDLGSVSL